MKLTILTENTAGGKFLAEHGLSYLIEVHNTTILFDTGHSDVFYKNATKLNINLQEKVDMVVLSHGHWDHGDGLQFITGKKLITHPDSFMARFRKNDMSPIGLKLSKSQIEALFDLQLSKKTLEIGKNIFFLGEIPRINNFEAKTSTFVDSENNPDFVPDDSALAIVENDELIIISGCAHSGICNIIDYAKKVSGINTVSSVIGGFHLKHNNAQTQKTIEYFKKEKIRNIYPSHCTELPALAAFYDAFKIQQVRTGMVVEF